MDARCSSFIPLRLELSEETGTKINLSQNGGYEIIDSNALDERISEHKKLKRIKWRLPYEILSSLKFVQLSQW